MKTLNEIELFNEYTIRNVPSFVFVLSFAACLISMVLSRPFGFFMLIFFMPLVFYIHRNDPHVLTIFFKSFSLPRAIKHGNDYSININKV